MTPTRGRGDWGRVVPLREVKMNAILPQIVLSVILQAWPLVLSLVFEVQCSHYLRKYRDQGCAAFHQGSGKLICCATWPVTC